MGPSQQVQLVQCDGHMNGMHFGPLDPGEELNSCLELAGEGQHLKVQMGLIEGVVVRLPIFLQDHLLEIAVLDAVFLVAVCSHQAEFQPKIVIGSSSHF